MLRRAGRRPQLSDALVGDELAVAEAEGLEARAAGGQDAEGGVGDQNALLKVHPLQQLATSGKGL